MSYKMTDKISSIILYDVTQMLMTSTNLRISNVKINSMSALPNIYGPLPGGSTETIIDH